MRIHLWCPVHSLSRLNYAVRLSTDRGTNALMQHTVSSSTQWPPSSTTNDVVFAHDSDDVALGQRALTRGILRQPSSARPESDKLFQALKLGQDKTQEHVASLELKVDGLSKHVSGRADGALSGRRGTPGAFHPLPRRAVAGPAWPPRALLRPNPRLPGGRPPLLPGGEGLHRFGSLEARSSPQFLSARPMPRPPAPCTGPVARGPWVLASDTTRHVSESPISA